MILPQLPDGLIIRPAIVWKIRPADTESLEVSYLTKGFAWHVNYVMNLQADKLDLAGWVEIRNESGTGFPNARIKLIAGEVKRVQEPPAWERAGVVYSSVEAGGSAFEEREFADYHMYTLQERTTLKNEQTKQIRLFQADDVPCTVSYRYTTGWKRADIMVTFENRSASRLGFPLPKGKVKVFREDKSDGQLEFIGEDEIDHTPKDETVSLQIGEAFDLVFEHKRKDVRRLGPGHNEETHEITIRNHKSAAASTQLTHHIFVRFWRIAETSHPYREEDDRTVVYELEVGAGEEVVVRFTVETDEKHHVMVSHRT